MCSEGGVVRSVARCSVLQCVAVWCSAFQRVEVFMLQCVAACCSVLHCVEALENVGSIRVN